MSNDHQFILLIAITALLVLVITFAYNPKSIIRAYQFARIGVFFDRFIQEIRYKSYSEMNIARIVSLAELHQEYLEKNGDHPYLTKPLQLYLDYVRTLSIKKNLGAYIPSTVGRELLHQNFVLLRAFADVGFVPKLTTLEQRMAEHKPMTDKQLGFSYLGSVGFWRYCVTLYNDLEETKDLFYVRRDSNERSGIWILSQVTSVAESYPWYWFRKTFIPAMYRASKELHIKGMIVSAKHLVHMKELGNMYFQGIVTDDVTDVMFKMQVTDFISYTIKPPLLPQDTISFNQYTPNIPDMIGPEEYHQICEFWFIMADYVNNSQYNQEQDNPRHHDVIWNWKEKRFIVGGMYAYKWLQHYGKWATDKDTRGETLALRVGIRAGIARSHKFRPTYDKLGSSYVDQEMWDTVLGDYLAEQEQLDEEQE